MDGSRYIKFKKADLSQTIESNEEHMTNISGKCTWNHPFEDSGI